MGLVRQHIRLSNLALPELEELDANALVDSGALELCVSPLIARQLRLTKIDEREIKVADGRKVRVDYVAPVKVEVFGRQSVSGALVTGDGVLLGAVPMESLDVMIDPQRQRLIPNPASPNIPSATVMHHHVTHRGED